MPCRDYESDDWSSKWREVEQYKEQANRLARIACKAMTELEDNGIVDVLLLKDDEVRAWWAIHKEADRKAREKEKERLRLLKVKKDALAKLTEEERRVLGIKK